MSEIHLHRLDLNLLVVFDALMDTRSVIRAAERLGKTPSAVSHALGRLREQLGDPLMVKVGGRMQPSPFALDLIEDVRPILGSIQRVITPPQPFEPATSHRVFRVAVLALPALISEVFARVHAVAPNIGLEWLAVFPDTAAKVADGQVDLTLMPAVGPLPDGLSEHVLAPDRRYTFARKGHPALSCWSREAWLRWPHVVVGMYSGARQTVEERMATLGLERQIGARIPDFSGIGPLLANSDMLANQIGLTVLGDLDVYDLQVLETPADLPDITFRFLWSARLANDPGNRWLRALMIGTYRDLQAKVAARLGQIEVIRPLA